MKKYGYIRVSTDAQSKDGTSLDSQREQLIAAGVKPDDIYTDAGVSGSVPLFDRPAGKKLQAEIATGDWLIVTKLDRAFRSMSDFCKVTQTLDEDGIGLVVLGMQPTPLTDNPYSRLILTFFAAFAQFERDLIRERTKDGRRVREGKGMFLGGKSPFGFKIVGDGQLEEEAWYANVCKRIRTLALANTPLRKIQANIENDFKVRPSTFTIASIRDKSKAVHKSLPEMMG